MPLYVISIDFSKAYDSLKRENLIDVLKDYKIHANTIGTLKNIYTGDWTNVMIGDQKIKMNVSSGIRQGCTASTTLFKLETYHIIELLEEEGRGFVDEMIKISVLFFADDGLILVRSVKDAERMIQLLVDQGDRSGLRINKDKSKILIFNSKSKPEIINGIKVTNELKYLGVTITDKKNCFKTQN